MVWRFYVIDAHAENSRQRLAIPNADEQVYLRRLEWYSVDFTDAEITTKQQRRD